MTDENLDLPKLDLDLTTDSDAEIGRPLTQDTDAGGVLEKTLGEDLDTTTPSSVADGGGPGRRIGGMLAAILGLVGCLLSLGLFVLSARVLFTASDTASGLMRPVSELVDRVDERVDQADDLLDRDGVDAADVLVLEARVDGLVDVVSAANRAYSAVSDSPIYNLLPENELQTVLESFQSAADTIDESVSSAGRNRDLGAVPAGKAADAVDSMQSAMTGARETVEEAESSFTSWLRLGSLVGMLGSLWSLWAQWTLLRRGSRGLRGKPA